MKPIPGIIALAMAVALAALFLAPRAALEKKDMRVFAQPDAANGVTKVKSGQVSIAVENGAHMVSILNAKGERIENVGALEKMTGPIR
jgi:hypothetical protein